MEKEKGQNTYGIRPFFGPVPFKGMDGDGAKATRQTGNNRWGWRFLLSPLRATESVFKAFAGSFDLTTLSYLKV